MAGLLPERAAEILAANAADVAGAEAGGLGRGLIDRLRLDDGRIADMARQIGLLADAGFPAESTPLGELPGGLRLTERRVPVGVIGRRMSYSGSPSSFHMTASRATWRYRRRSALGSDSLMADSLPPAFVSLGRHSVLGEKSLRRREPP